MGLALIAALATAAPVMSQETTRSIKITRASKLGDQTLAKGSYHIKFDEGKDGEIVFLQGKREVLKAAYKLIKLNGSPSDNVVVFTQGADGSFQIKRIEFKGKSDALSLE